MRTPARLIAVVLLLSVLPGSSSSEFQTRVAQTRVFSDLVSPVIAEDLNSDPDVVEIRLIAEEAMVDFGLGVATAVWTYNGTIPGPTIEAEVGNTVIVHFLNRLPVETTVHWHGVETPAHMDGSNISQGAVQPGHYFRYEFRVRHASTFWYHPHIQTHVQVEKGLHGALIVRDSTEDARHNFPTSEHVLVLDDINLDEAGNVEEPFPADPLENAVLQTNGREGNVMLVNGIQKQTVEMERGVPQRLRLINAANARFMLVSIEGHTMWRIGGDQGLLETPIEIAPLTSEVHSHIGGLLLTPGERADIVFTPTGSDPIKVEWYDMHRRRHRAFYRDDGSIGLGHASDDGARPSEVLMTFLPVGTSDATEYIPPASLRQIFSIDVSSAVSIPVMFGHTPPDAEGNVTFFAQMKNGMPLPASMVTKEDAPVVRVGDTGIWEVNNLTAGIHNFHSHGFSFQLIETVYVDMDIPVLNFTVPAPYKEIKDTIILPARTGQLGRSRTISRLAVYFSEEGREGQILASGKTPTSSSSGGWVFHCHLLEHAARGMLSFLQVREALPVGIESGLRAELPDSPQLHQNYPNPFNPQTTIHFTLNAPGTATVSIFNALGQRLETISSGRFAAGDHSVTWNATPYPTGVYLYRLEFGDYVETRKLVLQK